MSKFQWALFAVLATSAWLQAESPKQPQPTTSVDDQDAILLHAPIEIQLPKIVRDGTLRFTFHPSPTDIVRNEYIRFRIGARYALTPRIEISAEAIPYLAGFHGEGHKAPGIAEYRFGTKASARGLLWPGIDSAVGATAVIPGRDAAEQLNIGTNRITPYVTLSRDSTSTPGLTLFCSLSYEIFTGEPRPGRIARYRPSSDNLILTPGVALHRAPWHYAMAVSLRTTALSGGDRQYASLLPSVNYELPQRWTRRIPGRVVVGTGYECAFHPEGVDNRVSAQLRWDFDWRKAATDLLLQKRSANPSSQNP